MTYWNNHKWYCQRYVQSYGVITLIESTRGNEFRVAFSDEKLKKYYYTCNNTQYIKLARQDAQSYIDNFVNRFQRISVFI